MQILRNAKRQPVIGIDLGTAHTIAAAPGEGIVFDQPSICCFQGYDAVPRFVSAGTEASTYVGKVFKPLKIVRPLRNGVLSDMAAARELLHFVRKSVAGGRRFGRVRPQIGIPADATQSEKRALANAALDAGLGQPELVPEPLLAAMGLGLPIAEARGQMVVDCGAGVTEAVVISLGGICVSKSVRGGGEALDQALVDHLNFHHRFQIGVAAAEALKLKVSEILETSNPDQLIEVKGLDTTSGLPRLMTLPATEFRPVWIRHVDQIVSMVRETLRETPPELSHDVLEGGILLTGGGALGALLAGRISDRTGVATRIAHAPRHCVALGLQRLLEQRGFEGPVAV